MVGLLGYKDRRLADLPRESPDGVFGLAISFFHQRGSIGAGLLHFDAHRYCSSGTRALRLVF